MVNPRGKRPEYEMPARVQLWQELRKKRRGKVKRRNIFEKELIEFYENRIETEREKRSKVTASISSP